MQRDLHYQRARKVWALWAARAAATGDEQAEQVMQLCRQWVTEESLWLRLPAPFCAYPMSCTGRPVCPQRHRCDL